MSVFPPLSARAVTERPASGAAGAAERRGTGRGDGHGGDTVRRPRTALRLRARLAAVALGGAAAATLAPAGQAPAATAPPAQVYLVQGIPGVTADVLLDGGRIAGGVRPETVIGPVSVPAGQHVLTLTGAGRSLTGARFTVAAGQSIDLVARRTADGARTPQLMVFRNDLQPVGPGKGRLVVAHTGVAPPADGRVDGATVFHDVAPGEALSLLVPARSYAVDVRESQGSDTILGPVRVSVRAGTLTRVFAVGNPSDGTADAVVQVLSVPVVGAGRPRAVPTGDGGQAAESYMDEDPGPLPATALAVGAVALLLLTRVRPVRRLLRRER